VYTSADTSVKLLKDVPVDGVTVRTSAPKYLTSLPNVTVSGMVPCVRCVGVRVRARVRTRVRVRTDVRVKG